LNAYEDLKVSWWDSHYGYAGSPSQRGRIVHIHGVEGNDTYNPVLCETKGSKILAFRCEPRDSDIADTEHYHPSIQFARQDERQQWQVAADIAPFDMLEDPLFMPASIGGREQLVVGGVRAKLISQNHFIVNTELYAGDALTTIEREPFATIMGIKDERLIQLPDGRFLLCRRPVDAAGRGSAVLYVIDSLDVLVDTNASLPPAMLTLVGPGDKDWVGINNMYILTDGDGTQWIGLLGHIGAVAKNGDKHYAATTYAFKLEDLVNGRAQPVAPTIIATRSCFPDGPSKDELLSDVVFPGSLERLEDDEYRLWAGLSDAQIGTLDIRNPFKLRHL
jgi:hypothetical protein